MSLVMKHIHAFVVGVMWNYIERYGILCMCFGTANRVLIIYYFMQKDC